MITRLHGILAETELTEVTMDIQGVGYEVAIPMSTYDKLPPCGQLVTLWIHTHVREDTFRLFGFATKEERRLFRLLLNNASGIGPKLALNILSCMPVEQFLRAIAENNLKLLSAINGIGKRTAEKLAVDLKPHISACMLDIATSEGGKTAVKDKLNTNPHCRDAVAALETLGFKSTVAEKTVYELVDKLPEKDCTAENLIRRALTMLNS